MCTWFWLRLSSIAWHVPTDPGTSVILFLDKFTASRFLRVLIASGKWVSLFSDTFRVRKFDNCDIESGSLVNRFPSKDKCSSPFRFPISFGMISEKKQNNKALQISITLIFASINICRYLSFDSYYGFIVFVVQLWTVFTFLSVYPSTCFVLLAFIYQKLFQLCLYT